MFWGGWGEVAVSRLRRLSVRSPFLELVTDATDPAEVVASSAAQTPPSTRAGGQDDESMNKLPQIMCVYYNKAVRSEWARSL